MIQRDTERERERERDTSNLWCVCDVCCECVVIEYYENAVDIIYIVSQDGFQVITNIVQRRYDRLRPCLNTTCSQRLDRRCKPAGHDNSEMPI